MAKLAGRRYMAVQVYISAESESLWKVAKSEAKRRKVSLSALVTEALKAYLAPSE